MRIASCFALFLLIGVAPAEEPKAKPNVVIIHSGYQLGPRDLNCAGSTYYKTPNLDAFAKQGVRLEEAYSYAVSNTISGMAFWLGVWPERLYHPAPDEPRLRGGYEHEKLLAPYAQLQLPKNITFKEGAAPNDFDRAGYGRVFDMLWNPGVFRKKWKALGAKPVFATIDIMQLKPNPAKIAEYKPGKLGSQADPAYAAQVEELDLLFADILKTVEDLGGVDNTIIVFASNSSPNTVARGESVIWTTNAPFREGEGYLYEGGLRIPFLIRGPGVKKGGFSIIAADVLPTLAGLCGLKKEAYYDGIDLSPQFRGEAKPDLNRTFYWHLPQPSASYGRPGGAIRVGSMKLIEYFETDRRELFDLSKDIGESRNLAAEKPEVVKELAAKLAAWRKEVGAKMPTPNPDYRPSPQAKDGSITLHAHSAFVTGTQLRFEPAPHKNTLGYWTNKSDTASFEFTVINPGTFTVEMFQGAGKGSGGAEVELAVGDSKTNFTVKDTGGFQAFESVDAGELTIAKPGRYTLTITPKTKPGVAVMDVRKITLKPKQKQ